MSNVSDDERLVVFLEARIRDFERNLQKAGGTAKREYGQMRQDSRRATSAMETDMQRSTTRMNQALATVSTRAGAMSAAFGPMAIGIGAASAAMAGLVTQARSTAREIATIGDEARRAGIGAKAFQELKFVADQNRVSIDALTDGIKEMNLRADEFIVTGSGSGAEAFQRLGFTAEELAKKLEDPSKLFTEIIGKLEGLDRAAQIRVADEVFGGTGGEQFVQLIEQGEAGITRTIDEANRLGLVMDEAMIAKAVEVDRQFNIISQTVGTTLKGAIIDAASALNGFLDRFNEVEDQSRSTLESSLAFATKQRDQVAKRLSDGTFLEFMRPALEKQLQQSQDDVDSITSALEKLGAGGSTALDTVTVSAGKTGDSLDYVARNGGNAAASIAKTKKATDDAAKALVRATKAFEDQRRAIGESEAAMVRTIGMYGETSGAVAALEFKVREEARAWEIARAAKLDAIPAETQAAIDQAASSIGNLTDELERMNLQREQGASLDMLREEAGLIGMNADARRVAMAGLEAEASLRSKNIDTAGAWGQAYIRNAQQAAALRIEIDEQTSAYERQEQILSNLGSTFLDIFDANKTGSFFDSVISGFADIGRQFAELGKQRLLEQFFGAAAVYTTGKPAVGQRSVFPSAPVSFNAGFTAPIGRVEASPLPALAPGAGKLDSALSGLISTVEKSSSVVGETFDFSQYAVDGAKRSDSFSGMTPAFRSSLAQLLQNGPSGLQVGSGYRSVERQAQLFAEAVGKYGSTAAARKWVAPPGRSNHNSGNAADLYYNGRSLKHAPTSVVEMIHGMAGKYGLAFPLSNENWHVELLGARGQKPQPASTSFSSSSTFGFAGDVSAGVLDAQKKIATGAVPSIDPWAGKREGDVTGGGILSEPGMTKLGAGMQSLAAGFGAFSQGYQSGSPLMGGFSGAMSGLGASGAIASAIPALAGVAGPVGLAAGALAGIVGPIHGRRRILKQPERNAA